MRRGIGEPSREKTGRRSHSGCPTGSTGLTDMPLTTPAAEVYHATAAVTTPAQPPASGSDMNPLPAPLQQETRAMPRITASRPAVMPAAYLSEETAPQSGNPLRSTGARPVGTGVAQ